MKRLLMKETPKSFQCNQDMNVSKLMQVLKADTLDAKKRKEEESKEAEDTDAVNHLESHHS